MEATISPGLHTQRPSDPYAAEAAFWDFVAERQKIWHRRACLLNPPWTEDLILQRYHFCNVYRELDRGTAWYLDKVVPTTCEEFEGPPSLPDLLWRTIVYRLINNTAQFEAIGGVPSQRQWPLMVDAFRALSIKPHSPAYFILGWPGGPYNRLERLAVVLEQLEAAFPVLVMSIEGAKSLQSVSLALLAQYGIGPFLALQIFRDLILARAIPFTDDDWVEIGPGCAWALSEVFLVRRHASQVEALKMLTAQAERELRARETPLWNDSPPSLCDIENCMCEAGKYFRIKDWLAGGKRPRLRYYHGSV